MVTGEAEGAQFQRSTFTESDVICQRQTEREREREKSVCSASAESARCPALHYSGHAVLTDFTAIRFSQATNSWNLLPVAALRCWGSWCLDFPALAHDTCSCSGFVQIRRGMGYPQRAHMQSILKVHWMRIALHKMVTLSIHSTQRKNFSFWCLRTPDSLSGLVLGQHLVPGHLDVELALDKINIWGRPCLRQFEEGRPRRRLTDWPRPAPESTVNDDCGDTERRTVAPGSSFVLCSGAQEGDNAESVTFVLLLGGAQSFDVVVCSVPAPWSQSLARRNHGRRRRRSNARSYLAAKSWPFTDAHENVARTVQTVRESRRLKTRSTIPSKCWVVSGNSVK